MNIATLDALMQIASNGPSFDHLSSSGDPEIRRVLVASFEYWQLTTNRFPARAHGHQGRKKKGASAPLADLFEEQAKAARKAGGGDRLLEESDDSSDSGDNSDDLGSGGGRARSADGVTIPENSGNFEEVGDYEVPDGWIALEPPAEDEETWSASKKNYKWQNKKLAHIWDEPTGWQMSSYSFWEKGTPVFYYPSDRQKVGHQLSLNEYGVDGHWVILERE